MSGLDADPLSPIDAATLWPQLHRLATEVVATRSGENLLVSSGLAATGLTHLPRMPRTAVLGVRRGLTYRGVLVVRELLGGAAWEVVSVRIVREKDDDAVTGLLVGCCAEVVRRGGRGVLLRFAEGSLHADAIRKAGLMVYRLERLYAVPHRAPAPAAAGLRSATRADRAGIFRLYCRVVPEHVRRQEAPTLHDWRAVHDSYDCAREFVIERDGQVCAWVGVGDRETFTLMDNGVEGLDDAVLNLVEQQAGRQATIVLGEFQGSLEHNLAGRGYTALGVRLVAARQLALRDSLKEVVAVPVESLAVPQ
jgi:hypothetical protein